MNIQQAAILATLNISQWTARKYDKKASLQVELANNAKDAGRFNKILVAKESLEEISKVATASRSYHYMMTLAWDDNGPRLLPASLFTQYTTAIGEFKRNFRSAVDRFVRDYPALKTDARTRLGSMYEPTDYPPVEDIRERFAIEVSMDPIANPNDFRIQLNKGYIDELQRDLEERLTDRQKGAVMECWNRVRDVVGRIHERLSDDEAVFRDSLINNARELVGILPGLNFTNDSELEDVRLEVEKILVHPDRLRQDKDLRSETAEKAAAILAKLPKLGA